MAQISRSHATIRIIGDDLIPNDVTELLGCEPSASEFKGEEIVGKNTGRTRLAKTGSWRLTTHVREPEDLDGQISELLAQLTQEFSIWNNLALKYDIDLFIGLMMENSNEGCQLSSQSIRMLGERNISIGLDVYAAE